MVNLENAVVYWVYDRDLQQRLDPQLEIFKSLIESELIDIVQYRAKNVSLDSYLRWCDLLNKALPSKRPMVLANDFCNAVIPAGLDGVHIGQSDLPLTEARELLGGKIIGATARSEEAAANACGTADYIGAGTVFTTSTKPGMEPAGPEFIRTVISGVNVPVFPIGGINAANAGQLTDCGIRKAAVASCLLTAAEPLTELQTLRGTLLR